VKKNRADAVVIGGGVIGCSIARDLLSRGLTVTVVERDSPGRRATWAAAGMLSPLSEAGGAGPFLELADASLERFAAFAHALREESGIDIEYRTNGKLHVSIGDTDEQLRALATGPHATRFDVSLLDGAEARRREPALTPEVTSAALVGRDHRVNNRLLAQALLASATSAGAAFRNANPVSAVVTRGDRVAGVRLASGEQIEADHVVLAAGAWSGDVEGLPRPLPLSPIKGQMFAVDSRPRAAGRTGPLVQRVIFSRACYIIPRDDGRLLVGATVEDVGFRKGPTPRGIATLMGAAAAVMPFIDDLPLVETWAGFRPATPDRMPLLGTDPDVRGLYYATGHFRNGILLAPITAAIVGALAAGHEPPLDIAPFSVRRFG
jgi:glycine oxidase